MLDVATAVIGIIHDRYHEGHVPRDIWRRRDEIAAEAAKAVTVTDTATGYDELNVWLAKRLAK